ncbi:hypothetical protein [Kitasatospora sp. NPDC088548]|uniref:hypothetical protein n=1 Tax=Kitasatospora sp. NPDC088548 TaxID=3364075 RepID=UPI0037F2533E
MTDPKHLLAVAAADPVAASLAHLKQHPDVTAAFGGPNHVSGLVEAPWPRLRVTAGPGGNLRALRWDTATEVLLEVIGDPTGWPGSAELRRLTLIAAGALAQMPDQDGPPDSPVVSRVTPTGPLALTELTVGSYRYSATFEVVLHPRVD